METQKVQGSVIEFGRSLNPVQNFGVGPLISSDSPDFRPYLLWNVEKRIVQKVVDEILASGVYFFSLEVISTYSRKEWYDIRVRLSK